MIRLFSASYTALLFQIPENRINLDTQINYGQIQKSTVKVKRRDPHG